MGYIIRLESKKMEKNRIWKKCKKKNKKKEMKNVKAVMPVSGGSKKYGYSDIHDFQTVTRFDC
jgi:hypothetical protein